jgi:hypothetical protein
MVRPIRDARNEAKRADDSMPDMSRGKPDEILMPAGRTERRNRLDLRDRFGGQPSRAPIA